MAKSSMIAKNERRIAIVARYSSKRESLKKRIHDKSISQEERISLQFKLNSLPRDSMPSRIRNRCGITGRPRGYYRKFGLCRNKIRECASASLLPGLTKSSW